MSKTIDTLIEDVYTVIEGAEISDELAQEFGRKVAKLIQDRLKSNKEKREPYLRLSMIGRNDRQIWHELKGCEPEPMPSFVKLKFLYGDLIEELLLFLAKAAGHTVEGEQDEIFVDGVKGHRDAIIDGVPVDVKSASSYSFNKFRDGSLFFNDSFGYIYQISAYCQGDERGPQDLGAFWAFNKVTGQMCVLKVEKEYQPDVSQRVQHVKALLESDEPPERDCETKEMGKNTMLTGRCQFCSMKKHCWADCNDGKGLRTFQYSKGPVHLTEVNYEPNVKEITDDY